MHHPVDNKPGVTGDTTVDEVYIPAPDYSMSDNLMAVPPGMFVRFIHVLQYSVIGSSLK